jgi:hypothetical protein
MKPAVKLGLAALAGVIVLGVLWKGASHRNRRQELAHALKLAGYPEDDAGRIILRPNDNGLSLAYDPNLYDPTTGFRACMGRITACFDATKRLDSCVKDSPRCVSSTPWKNDPAGDDCCPESCVQEYFELRKTASEAVAVTRLVRGTCYPGMKELFGGKKP